MRAIEKRLREDAKKIDRHIVVVASDLVDLLNDRDAEIERLRALLDGRTYEVRVVNPNLAGMLGEGE